MGIKLRSNLAGRLARPQTVPRQVYDRLDLEFPLALLSQQSKGCCTARKTSDKYGQ
ncbi:hypothetical protein CY34DRAFT_802800 [Suillus luteus UH-Slu-Lm8-n1]|uniref:Uncharacterized protein n=1 Tax=Suillus luteus UH-Slu-Lm8-n1 TaxID=930992 RepID=A0A0D0ARC5_9AGAM|nr:hypothetical protein CY34DRAFT_802800 [Suillus luteus UH-Slu-Lm8-n1]